MNTTSIDPAPTPSTVDPLNATLIMRQDLTEELAIVRIQPDCGLVPEFEPGQFIEVALPAMPRPEVEATMSKLSATDTTQAPPQRVKLTRRVYSIASAKQKRDYVELYLVLVKVGRLTPRLWPLNVGDRLWLADHTGGHFTLDEIPRQSNIIAIATGTGAAPFISMLRSYASTARWNRFTLVHGVRLATELGYAAEISHLIARDPSIVYLPTLTREPENSPWAGLRGRVQKVFEQPLSSRLFSGKIDPLNTHILLCGNPEMIKSMQILLEPQGFVTQTRERMGNLHFERYW